MIRRIRTTAEGLTVAADGARQDVAAAAERVGRAADITAVAAVAVALAAVVALALLATRGDS
ncbi:hypothetical protein E1265_21320 [Streptomyces sp. 8K308]|nr:hypothetical protein E1265_21320 [Streptomyces sp. 8K308]